MMSKFLFVGLPFIDMIYVVFSRIMAKKSIFYPDRIHFHYKLIDSGISHTNAVLICYLIGLLFLLLGLFL